VTSIAAPPPHVGTVLGDRYELVRHIARGGMGDVYEAEDRLLQRRAAVKLYRAASPADRARFDAEVRVLAGLNHPGLVRVYDAGPHGEDAFVVLELIEGAPLSETLTRGAIPPTEVAALGAELSDALAYIHAQGVVHRDVTPANVLCDEDGRPRLVDFGIARLLDSPRLTATAIAVGTAAYMSPEQVQGLDVTPAADVYALGLVLLEAITGRREFEGSMQEVATARLVRDPDTDRGVPGAWRTLLAAMTSRIPEERPTTEEVRDRLPALASSADEATAPVAAVGAGPVVSGDAPTQAIPTAGATSVLPVSFVPLEVTEPAAPRRSMLPLWAAVAAIAAVLVVGLVAGADSGGKGRVPTTTVPQVATELEDEPSTTVATTTTTLAPTTTTGLLDVLPLDVGRPDKPKKDRPGPGDDDEGDD